MAALGRPCALLRQVARQHARWVTFRWGADVAASTRESSLPGAKTRDGASQPAEACLAAASLRQRIVSAADQDRFDAKAHELVGHLVADGQVFGPEVTMAMLRLGLRSHDSKRVIHWWGVARAEGHELPLDLQLQSLPSLAAQRQHEKAVKALSCIARASGVAISPPDGPQVESAALSDATVRFWSAALHEWPRDTVKAAATSLVNSGHVSCAFPLQQAAQQHLQTEACGEDSAAGSLLAHLAVLWMPVGRADAAVEAFSSLLRAGAAVPIPLTQQLLQAAASAGSWEAAVDILDTLRDCGQKVPASALLALDACLQDIVMLAAIPQGSAQAHPRWALRVLQAASQWADYSFPAASQALGCTLLDVGLPDLAADVCQVALTPPRSALSAHPPTTFINRMTGHWLRAGQHDRASRVLFAAHRLWGEAGWVGPTDLLPAWATTSLSPAAPAADQDTPLQWLESQASVTSTPLQAVSLAASAAHLSAQTAAGVCTSQLSNASGTPLPVAVTLQAACQASRDGAHRMALSLCLDAVLVSISWLRAAHVDETPQPPHVRDLLQCVAGAVHGCVRAGDGITPLRFISALLAAEEWDRRLAPARTGSGSKPWAMQAAAGGTACLWNAAASAAFSLSETLASDQGHDDTLLRAHAAIALPWLACRLAARPRRHRPQAASAAGYELLPLSRSLQARSSQRVLPAFPMVDLALQLACNSMHGPLSASARSGETEPVAQLRRLVQASPTQVILLQPGGHLWSRDTLHVERIPPRLVSVIESVALEQVRVPAQAAEIHVDHPPAKASRHPALKVGPQPQRFAQKSGQDVSLA